MEEKLATLCKLMLVFTHLIYDLSKRIWYTKKNDVYVPPVPSANIPWLIAGSSTQAPDPHIANTSNGSIASNTRPRAELLWINFKNPSSEPL